MDNWAAGVINYILLCGFPPFRNKQPDEINERMTSSDLQEEIFEQIQKADYEFLSPYWDEVSSEAVDLVRRLLVINKRRRKTAVAILQHEWVRKYTCPQSKFLGNSTTVSCSSNSSLRYSENYEETTTSSSLTDVSHHNA